MKRISIEFLLLAPLLFVGLVLGRGMQKSGGQFANTFQGPETSRPVAEIQFNDMRPARPPLVYLTFDVTLRNDHKLPRWFLLPSNVGPGRAAIGAGGGVDALEVYAPRGIGRVLIGRFLGTGGFNAILLQPHALVRLRQFPISYWGDPPKNLDIEVVIAKRLTVGNQKAESWFGPKPASSVKVDISEDAGNAMRIIKSKHTPDQKEVTTNIEVDRRLQLQVALEK